MTIERYIDNINQRFRLGNATEHTFRGDLQQLLESIVPDIRATNEPKRQSCGAPDYILTGNSFAKKDIPIGFIEAKDIGDKDLAGIKKTGNKEQFDRYKASLSNLIFTDYLDFHLYHDGIFITKIAIAELTPLPSGESVINAIPENFSAFANLIKDFCGYVGQTIKSSKKLAEMMASKARLLADVIEQALTSDETHNEDSTLKDQMHAFKDILIHDITPKGFADVYAQTIAYGMFAARLHDPTLPTFSRQEAAELIPKSNPFLRKLFGYIAGPDIDDRIIWIVDGLVEVFLACNVEELLKNYGKATNMQDPIIHFYETFLSEYDPALRKARGVWYTPQPVVNFIVRAVDDILKTEFDLPQGLADTSKIKLKAIVETKATTDTRSKITQTEVEHEVHRVQILDPATGTGTFLAEVVKHIHRKFEGQRGIWSSYVENHLIPRLNGFELLMASYAMAHLKLDLLLTETGYKPTKNQRFKVFLTNSLEEHHPDTGTLFANWLSTEANEANHIKRDTPVMCVIGNPPYNRSSNNSNIFINQLLNDYKKGLNERNLVPLDDDYIKFIRLGQQYIDRNNSGILSYISANSFLDGITHRQMRMKLLESFDKIYILNLHGNAKKNEVSPDGSPDQNVFDIMTGVSINIFVKTGKKQKDELGEVFYLDLYGKRDFKYNFLLENNIKTLNWTEIITSNYEPWKVFESTSTVYNEFISLVELFNNSSPCIRTHSDNELISFDSFKNKFNQKYLYKVFDYRFVNFDLSKIGRPRMKVMKELIQKENFGLIFQRGSSSDVPNTPFITKIIADQGAIRPGTTSTSTLAPLYLYPESTGQLQIGETQERTPNLNAAIVQKIAEGLGLEFTPEPFDYAQGTGTTKVAEQMQGTTVAERSRGIAPIDILDYIYAVLHSPTYREKYKEFLKIDFPRVPYPKDAATFWKLVALGGELRQIHLLESSIVEQYITQYPEDGDNVVGKIRFDSAQRTDGKGDRRFGSVYINSDSPLGGGGGGQYFANVPEIAWNFYIGGYQPAQKWLKDRKDRKLEFEDILHYQKIIVALTETDRIMKAIDEVAVIIS